MKIGMIAPVGSDLCTNGSFLRDYAGTIEECGVDSVWTVEHVVVADDYEPLYPYAADGRIPSNGGTAPMPDPLEMLTHLGACSSTLLLGTAVVVAPLHSPAVLAKRASTLALLTDGRLRLGLGIGSQREEYAAVGVPYADRGRRLEECIDAMRALWAGPSASYEGKYWSFSKVSCNPRPTRRHGADRARWQHRSRGATRWTGRRRVVPVHDLARRLRDPNRAPADGCTRRRSRSVVGRHHGLAGQLRLERRSRPRVGAPVRGGGGRSPGVRVATVRKRRPRTARDDIARYRDEVIAQL